MLRSCGIRIIGNLVFYKLGGKTMIQQTHNIRIKDNVLDLVKLPEAAQDELLAFYEFLGTRQKIILPK